MPHAARSTQHGAVRARACGRALRVVLATAALLSLELCRAAVVVDDNVCDTVAEASLEKLAEEKPANFSAAGCDSPGAERYAICDSRGIGGTCANVANCVYLDQIGVETYEDCSDTAAAANGCCVELIASACNFGSCEPVPIGCIQVCLDRETSSTEGDYAAEGDHLTEGDYITEGDSTTEEDPTTEGDYTTTGDYATEGPSTAEEESTTTRDYTTEGPSTAEGDPTTEGAYSEAPHPADEGIVASTTAPSPVFLPTSAPPPDEGFLEPLQPADVDDVVTLVEGEEPSAAEPSEPVDYIYSSPPPLPSTTGPIPTSANMDDLSSAPESGPAVGAGGNGTRSVDVIGASNAVSRAGLPVVCAAVAIAATVLCAVL